MSANEAIGIANEKWHSNECIRIVENPKDPGQYTQWNNVYEFFALVFGILCFFVAFPFPFVVYTVDESTQYS